MKMSRPQTFFRLRSAHFAAVAEMEGAILHILGFIFCRISRIIMLSGKIGKGDDSNGLNCVTGVDTDGVLCYNNGSTKELAAHCRREGVKA